MEFYTAFKELRTEDILNGNILSQMIQNSKELGLYK